VHSAAKTKLLAVTLALLGLAAAPSGEEKRISIYSSVATYTLPVIDRGSREYVGLLELLEPLGRVTSNAAGARWKLRYNNVDSEFVAGRTRCRIRGRDLDLPAPFLMESSRGLVPISSLSTLLPQFLGNPVSFRDAARRLFIGDVTTQVSAQLDNGNPPHLLLNFSAPVNPTIATEPGKLRMVFMREPLVPPGRQSLTFNNAAITQMAFSESNGSAELSVAATIPLMASFSNGGRTITIAAASAANAPSSGAEQAPASSTQGPAEGTPSATGVAPRRILIVIDASHGGAERGAALTDTLAEKTVTLGFARLLRHELEQQGYAVILLREGDDTLTLDQRAGAANASGAALCISLHAGSQGTGMHVYTAMLPSAVPGKGPFQPWDSAQTASLPMSQSVAAGIVGAMQKHELSARLYSASLRPLNNLIIPAIAVELAPGPNGISDLPSANYQQKAAAAIADGLSTLRDRLGAQP